MYKIENLSFSDFTRVSGVYGDVGCVSLGGYAQRFNSQSCLVDVSFRSHLELATLSHTTCLNRDRSVVIVVDKFYFNSGVIVFWLCY